MKAEYYQRLFDSCLDNNLFNQFVALSPTSISHDRELIILDNIAFRLQIEFQKQVILLTNKEVSGDIAVINKSTKVSEIPLIINNLNSDNNDDSSNVVCLIDIDFPYFEENNSWENRLIETLKYYRIPVFGFCSRGQILKIYEN